MKPRRDDWFRSDAWDDDARISFEAHLARARPRSRSQYRRIKALSLLASDDPRREQIGESLLQENLEDLASYTFERTASRWLLAVHQQAKGRDSEAEAGYREVLADVGPGGNNTDGDVETALAEILIARGGAAALNEAKDRLDSRASQQLMFVKSRYRLALAYARLYVALGAPDRAREWAAAALELADTPQSAIPDHPKLALVDAPPDEIRWLQDAANRWD